MIVISEGKFLSYVAKDIGFRISCGFFTILLIVIAFVMILFVYTGFIAISRTVAAFISGLLITFIVIAIVFCIARTIKHEFV